MHAILLKAKRNFIEANLKFDKYERPENMSHMQKSEQEIYDKVEEIHDGLICQGHSMASSRTNHD